MKAIPLQLLTVIMENGQQGIFVGVPMVAEDVKDDTSQISEVWFSSVRDIPHGLPVAELMELVQAQLCRGQGKMH